MAVVAIGLDSLAGQDAKDEALDRAEAPTAAAELERRISNGILRRAVKAWRSGDIARAGKLALEATTADPGNAQAYHVLAMSLERMGYLHKALVTYERAFQLDPDDPDLLINLGLTAWNLKMTDAAVGLFKQFVEVRPDSPLGYNNLGTILCELGQPEKAIDILRSAIFRLPHEAILWNSIATVLAECGRADESIVFYQEAIRLQQDFPRPWHNLGFAFSHLGRLDEALEAYEQALKRAVDPTEVIEGKHSRSVCLIGMGRLEEGFREYEIRNTARFRAYVHHVLKAPKWDGEKLEGKRLLLVGEQGLGDEIMFANIVPDLVAALGDSGQLDIAVDPRLVPLFARSFPTARVGAYDDRKLVGPDGTQEVRFVPWATEGGEPEFYAPMGTALQHLRKSLTDFRKETFLIPDPQRVAAYRARLQALGNGPFIGICWRSMMRDVKRQKYFSPLEAWAPIFEVHGAKFVNVQYGDCRDELDVLHARYGMTVHAFEDIDLKRDIEGAAALSQALDLVISAPTAAGAIAGAVGTEVWLLTAGRTWPQLGTDIYPWYPRTQVLSPDKFGDWSALMPDVAARLTRFAGRN